MIRRIEWSPTLIISAALVLIATATKAQISDFEGEVEVLDPPPEDVRLGALESDTVVFAFDEKQNVLLENNLHVDTTTGDFISPGVIPAGTVVNSHLIHVDPEGPSEVTFFPRVTIYFESEILGFYFKNPPTALYATDELLGLSGTMYEKSPDVPRGAGGFPDLDVITIPEHDPSALTMSLRTFSGNLDEIRVITKGEARVEDPRPKFTRADCNGDNSVDLADAVCALNFLFDGANAADCRAALDVNGDASVNITDPVSLLNFLFAGGPAPVAPFPDCGRGMLPADDELGCANPPNCQ